MKTIQFDTPLVDLKNTGTYENYLIFIGYGENHLIVPTYDFIIRLDMIINQEAILMILHIL